jgi:hypothetical protein
MSRPISAMACTTAGFSSLAGSEPAEDTRTRPAACWLRISAAMNAGADAGAIPA